MPNTMSIMVIQDNNGKIHAALNLGAGGCAETMPLTSLMLILLHQQWTVKNGHSIDGVNVSVTDNHQHHTQDVSENFHAYMHQKTFSLMMSLPCT